MYFRYNIQAISLLSPRISRYTSGTCRPLCVHHQNKKHIHPPHLKKNHNFIDSSFYLMRPTLFEALLNSLEIQLEIFFIAISASSPLPSPQTNFKRIILIFSYPPYKATYMKNLHWIPYPEPHVSSTTITKTLFILQIFLTVQHY